MRIAITGGAGFIGSTLAKRLTGDGHDVLLIDDMSSGHLDNIVGPRGPIAPTKFVDVRVPYLPELLDGSDICVHLAGLAALPACESNPGRAFDVNTSATAHVLASARHVGVKRVIFSSTSAVYENSPALPQRETDDVAPDLVYSQSKLAAERICDAAARNYGQDVIICRFFNLYGPHQDALRTSPPFTSYVARELALGRRPRLFNQSTAERDYIFADDAVELLCMMISSPDHHAADIFNVGSGSSHSVPDLYRLFQEIADTSIEPTWGDPAAIWDDYPQLAGSYPLSPRRIEKEVRKASRADLTKVSAAFDWTPVTPIREGLAKVLHHAQRLVAQGKLATG